MAATAKYNKQRVVWLVRCNQHNTQWNKALADEPTARQFARLTNARMRAGEDMRPPDKRGAATTKATAADTVRAFGDRWLVAGWKGRKMATNNSYARHLRLRIYPALGDMPVAKITRATCVAFCRGLLGKPNLRDGGTIKLATRQGVHSTLSALLAAAVEADLLAANPAAHLDKYLVDPDEVREAIAVLNPAEADRFLDNVGAIRPEYYAFFFVALRTGLRVGELVELRWDLDFDVPHAIHVQRAYAINKRTTATIAADGSFAIEAVAGASDVSTPKGKRDRVVDTSADVDRVLARHRVAQKADALKRGEAAPALVFTTPSGKRINPRNLRAQVLVPLVKAAKVAPIDVHGLRHTYASMLISRGERLDYVSRQLGHANQSTTERRYRHFIPDNAAEAVARRKRLDEVWAVDKGAGQ
jgi:integrase